jgi:hypothetical protein
LSIGYELFTGNAFEGHTLDVVRARLQDLYKVERVTFMADSALLSDDNLEKLDE